MKSNKEIEDYLRGDMNASDRAAFEKKVSEDPGLEELLKSYQLALDGLRRNWVQGRFESFGRQRLFKGITLGALSVAAVFIALSTWFHGGEKELSNHEFKDTMASVASSNDSIFVADKVGRQEPLLPVNTGAFAGKSIFSVQGDASGIGKGVSTGDGSPDFSNFVSLTGGVQWQYSNLDNTVDDTVELKGGTKLVFKSNVLIDANGRHELKQVRLRVKEFKNYYDLWLEGLHTCSGDKRLISGGSLFIEAESQGARVSLDTGKTFTILFASKKDSSMSVFYGDWKADGSFDWLSALPSSDSTLDGYLTPSRTSVRDIDRKKKRKSITLYDTTWYLEPITMDEGMVDGNYTFNTLQRLNVIDTVFNAFMHTKSVNVKNMYINRQNFVLRFHVDSSGWLDRYDYNFKVDKSGGVEIKRIANEMIGHRRLSLGNLKFSERIVNLTLRPKFKVNARDSLLEDAVVAKLDDFKKAETIYNAIVSSNFGYINCDHFAQDENLTKMTIHSGIGELLDVRVFFETDCSVMKGTISGKDAHVPNIPMGARILIIAVSADGKKMFVSETISDKRVETGIGEPFDALKIKNVLMGYGI